MASQTTFYEKAPIVERLASLYVEMEEESFASHQLAWEEMVREEFPIDASIKRWMMEAQEKDGAPDFNTIRPLLQIIPRFSTRSEEACCATNK